MLAGAPKLTIMITSRHLTGVPGEQAFAVVPLAAAVDPGRRRPDQQRSVVPAVPDPAVDQQSGSTSRRPTLSSGSAIGSTGCRWPWNSPLLGPTC